MVQAYIDLERVQAIMDRREWTRMDLFRVMERNGFEGGYRSVYNVFDGETENPGLTFVALLAKALRVDVDDVYYLEGESPLDLEKSKKG